MNKETTAMNVKTYGRIEMVGYFYQDYLDGLDSNAIERYCKKCNECEECPLMEDHPVNRFQECETLQEVF